jgi:hypothetical protein
MYIALLLCTKTYDVQTASKYKQYIHDSYLLTRRRVGRPNLRWMDGVMDAERLVVRNWRSKAKDRDGWR